MPYVVTRRPRFTPLKIDVLGAVQVWVSRLDLRGPNKEPRPSVASSASIPYQASMESDATIVAIRQETPSVKSLVLELERDDFAFLPGQYVDLAIQTPEDVIVGGFSITSSPLQKGTIELAIKKLPYGRAALHLHERAAVGDTVLVAGPSGDFFYQPAMGGPLLLIAGGIGITPLMSILRFAHDAQLDVRLTLLYSAKTPSELAFYDELKKIAAQNPRIKCRFTVTQPHGEPWQGRVGRIDASMLREHIEHKDTLVYLCGPPGMLGDVTGMLQALGVEASGIKVEQW